MHSKNPRAAALSHRACDGALPKRMLRQEIIEHFGKAHVVQFPNFRALCNALKALSIQTAVQIWRGPNKGRATICDLGCGKGGDLGKWMPHRPKKLVGIDGSAKCIAEAVARHSTLVSNGRGSIAAEFLDMDLCDPSIRLPFDDNTIDIVSSHFFLQFAAESEGTFHRILSESSRVLSPGGVLIAVLPDGDRIFSLLERGDARSQRFGHFALSTCEGKQFQRNQNAFNCAYQFSLGEEACTEFLVPSQLLSTALRLHGLETTSEMDNVFSKPAHQFFVSAAATSSVAANIMKGQNCSHLDWLSLGLFRVFIARKTDPSQTRPRAEQSTNSKKEKVGRQETKRGTKRKIRSES